DSSIALLLALFMCDKPLTELGSLSSLLYTSWFRLSIDIYRFSIFPSRYSIVIYRTTASNCCRFPNRILHGIQAFSEGQRMEGTENRFHGTVTVAE
ncbi:hypothetical protein, partial [Faecalibaculum rodentium]|uniref:hypothetical protein n=1 Tax=Faecalibaculum rodentium TaxID=1702221 RepID=UPI003512EC5D